MFVLGILDWIRFQTLGVKGQGLLLALVLVLLPSWLVFICLESKNPFNSRTRLIRVGGGLWFIPELDPKLD